MDGAARDSVRIVYDGQCPACAAYFRLQRLRQSGIEVDLIDARGRPDLVRAYAERGIDLDHDFVLVVGEAEYAGADAMFVLASLGTRGSFFRRLNFHLFRTPAVARAVYPLLRAGRRLSLLLLARPRLDDRDA